MYQPFFSDIVKPHTFIENWRGQILGIPDLPQSHWYSQYHDLLNDDALTAEQKEAEVRKLEEICGAVGSSPLFVDNSHPGDIAYIHLTSRLLKIIDSDKNS